LSEQHLQAKVTAIETALGERRQEDAIQALATAQAAQLAAEGKHPLLLQAAEKNAAISEELVKWSVKIDGTSQAAIETEAQAKELEDNYRSVRQKLDVAGMNKALGRILQEQRAALPSRHNIQSQLENQENLIADITLQQLIFDEKKKELSDLDAFVESKMTELESEPGDDFIDREALAAQLKTMLQQRQSLYTKISTISAAYLRPLSDLEYAKQRLLEVVKEYDTFLGQRLLWVRSAPNPSFDSLLSFSGDVAHYFSHASWSKVFELLFALDLASALLLVGLLTAMVLRWRRPELLQRLRETNKPLGNPVTDRFSYSLQALVITLLLSAPGPMVLGALGIKLKLAIDHNALSQSLAQALLWVSRNWYFIAALRQVCRRDGLAERHFRWYLQALEPLRRELALLMATFLPVSFVTVLLASLDSSSMEWGIVRLAMIISMTLYALFFVRLLRKKGSVIQMMTALDPGALLVRWRRFWLVLSVIIPLILIGLAITGYVYTALILMGSLVETFWIVIIVILVHQLFVRWLRMTSIKLNYQALQEERKKQLQEIIASRQEGKERPDLLNETELDLAHLSRGSLKLVNIVSGLFAIIGLLLVWSNVLPALGYLDTIALWSQTGIEGGEVVVNAVSLIDLGLALLFLGLVYIVYRDLPSLLELLLRQQVSAMNAGDRYTAITLMRYVLLLAGVFMVAGLLGISWSQFQWMAAALGVGIGFGLQEIVANFISGLIILFERPIRVGDQVTIGDVDGTVTRIRARATTVLTWDRQELLVPNKEFITGRLLNWTLSDQVTRLVVEVGVAYGSDVTRAMALVIEAAKSHEKVLEDPAPFVTFDSFGDNTLNLKLRCFTDDIGTRLITTSALHDAINTAFNQAGIVIAFPQRDIHFDADQVMNIRLAPESAVGGTLVGSQNEKK
jgi:potassium efflux system protein